MNEEPKTHNERNAGRKPIHASGAKVNITVGISQEAFEKIKGSQNRSKLITDLILNSKIILDN
jgi:hypothetical protein